MDNSVGQFVENIKARLSRIEANLSNEGRLKYQKDIDMIYRLLDLFEDTGGVSKEIKKKLDEATKKISKVIEGKELLATKGLSPVKPNIDTLDEETINKAKMVNASNVFLETDNNIDATNESLRGTGFKVDGDLSTDEGLVLTNPETNEVKVSFRGTNTSYKRPIQSVKDLVSDVKIISGTEQYGGEGDLQTGRNLIQSAIDKYGNKENMEIVGHSLGGAKALLLGDEFGINTTTFNPLIGYNSMKASTTNTQHNLFRTTEDITSLGAGFSTEKKNWNVKSILPKKISLDPREAHRLTNFLDNKGRHTGTSPLETKINNVFEAGKRKAQVEDFNDTFDLLSGIDDIPGIDQRVMEQRLQMNYPSSSELLDESSLQEPTPQPEEMIDTSDLQRRMNNLIQDKPVRENVFNPDDFKNKNARDMANMRKGRFEKFSIEGDPVTSEKLPSTKKFTGKASDISLGIFEPVEPDKQIKDIDFDDMTDFFRNNSSSNPNKINDFELSSLNDDEIDTLMTGSDKDRNSFEELTNNEFNDSVNDLDNHIKLSTENIESGGFGEDLIRGLSPTNLLGGLAGGFLSQQAVDFIDPDKKIQKQVREGLIGSGAGLIGGLASAGLGAEVALFPETIAGGAGYLAGEEATESITKLTGSRAAGDVIGSGIGGAVSGATLALGGAVAADLATGAAIGTALDPVTAGLGTVIGAGIGSAIGGISYGLHKLFG